MSLPADWIDMVFEKLTLVYGQQFLRRWADVDLAKVKADWAHELSGFENHPKAIAYALQNLPADQPPTVLQFRSIARRAPPEDLPRLDAPKVTPSVMAAERAKLAKLLQDSEPTPSTAWAYRIVARAEAGERVSPTVLGMARFVVERRNGMGGNDE